MSRSGRVTLRAWIAALLCAAGPLLAAEAVRGPDVSLGPDGRLSCVPDPLGNRIPDFSHCGYAGGDRPVPEVPVVWVLEPQPGDNTARIQAALDELAARPLDDRGWRGALLLLRGRYEIAGQLVLRASGVVLRGQGMGTNGTVLVATGTDRRTLVRVCGAGDRTLRTNASWTVTDAYVPVGATDCRLRDAAGLEPGQRILVVCPSTHAWIEKLGMQELGGGVGARWKPGSRDVAWERTLLAVEGDRIRWDVPLTTPLEAELGGGWIAQVDWPGRLRNVGIENLCLELARDPERPWDEDHAWCGITLEAVEDAWVRQVTVRFFAGSAVAVYETARRVTVQDCVALDPVSELGGHRRETFFTAGQQTLFLRCFSQRGRRDFGVGHAAAGPNAFVLCQALESHGDSGALGSWASGVLFDNVQVDGGGLNLGFWPGNHQAIGWAAAYSVLWNCSASVIRCWNPPGAWNVSFGSWGGFEGNGIWQQSNEFVRPESLWRAQVRTRLGPEAAAQVAWWSKSREEVTNPTPERAAELTRQSREPAGTLRSFIESLAEGNPALADPGEAPRWRRGPISGSAPSHPARPVQIVRGWLVVDGRLLTGGILKTAWWRGSLRPEEAAQSGPALTRFVPGRIGPGWTDDLDDVLHAMEQQGRPVFEHHHGLWYDRRRDDHQMIRRPDGDVVAPFFEQPFARSGQGRAWDGLSRYDLTRFNPWYWSRLRDFAVRCESRGFLLLHQHYFQHNVLEAGAHWADFPWRTANNINDTGFPEPPPYAGDKRIFMAEAFYDVTHPVRRPLHRRYIRQCLEALRARANVLHSPGAEFTGPVHFVRFWLDVVDEWAGESREDPVVVLSAPKDVQDTILGDPRYTARVDVIDFRYWWRTAQGEFAPPGGQHLAPRQWERRWRGGRPRDEDLAAMAAEYRRRFPDKALLCDFDTAGWAWLCAGGSLPRLPTSTDPELLRAVPRMLAHQVQTAAPMHVLVEAGQQWLVWTAEPAVFTPGRAGETWERREVSPQTGQVVRRETVDGAARLELGPGTVWWLVKRSDPNS